jgi:hypothetical protein
VESIKNSELKELTPNEDLEFEKKSVIDSETDPKLQPLEAQ